MTLEVFPMTTSGKTDRQVLREIGASFTPQQLVNVRTSDKGRSGSLPRSSCGRGPKEAIPAFSLLGEDADATQVRKQVAVSCGVDTSLIEDIYPCSPLQKGMMALTSKRSSDYIM
ncbi:hypothetical protein P3342_011703 [Pyrenophora teres f. teres]|nr:hypothetical protein P3342_011703 [Pyrenophora teres f. teres]